MNFKGKNIVVALSGGVDSSVAALLLKQKGANVKGVIMDLSPYLDSKKDIEDAQKIADQLNITLTIVNLSKDFRKKVIQYFLDESWKGRTPNPCVPCNMFLKFGLLYDYAIKKMKADYYATGHYAVKKWDRKTKRWLVYRPKDIKKDQSSILSMLTQKQLTKSIFPLGKIKKEEIYKIAEKYNLHSKNREESQDLCFLNSAKMSKGEFIEKVSKKKSKKGKILNTKGEKIGEHKGYIYYPLGQRKGLGLSAPKSVYVKKIDTKNNILTVGTRDELKTNEFYVSAVNWVAFKDLKKPISAEVIVRNKQTPHKARIYPITTQQKRKINEKIAKKENRVKVVSDEPIFAVSPGQLAVFFKKDLILGGGWIK
ncbi:tRNA 2-thiouridine(34) synthase MnmA [Candidatus Micrarchaeota archaeon]|jgi:tRNA-specific 2-thiouridylase|nr:tRNA 2-thiouridine(34) synthase MnmA [Candidatus Micrarchaeota archaeon]